MPYCVFTDPPFGRVGLIEREARTRGITPRVTKLPVSAVLRAHTIDTHPTMAEGLGSLFTNVPARPPS